MGRLEIYRSVVNCNLCLVDENMDQVLAEEGSELKATLDQV